MQHSNTDFVTHNACEDVSADTIARWYKKAPMVTFEDLSGMADLKAQLLQDAAQILHTGGSASENAHIYFFYGPPGCGKTAIIRAFAHEMMERDENFRFIQLTASDIYASLVGVAEKTVEIAFREALDNEPCLIYIDEIDMICRDRGAPGTPGHVARLTTAFLRAIVPLFGSHKRVIFMGATSYPDQVDTALLYRVKWVRVPLPDANARADFFARTFEKLVLEEGFTYADMAAETDGYSCRELVRIAEGIEFQLRSALIENHKIYDENGSFDPEASVLAAEQALAEGRIRLTRAMFQECLRSNPPYDKTAALQQLKAFEERANILQSE